jgi:outer membrane protein OmpA-like peptidoglycan-associated protein
MTLYTRYDFVPGDRVVFYDDLSGYMEADFPNRWKLKEGVFEVARFGDEKWILCTDDGSIMPKLPSGTLPDRYTVEMEFYSHGSNEYLNLYALHWLDAKNKRIAHLEAASYGTKVVRFSFNGRSIADKQIVDKFLPKGVHTLRAMITPNSLKAYLDHERVVNMPIDEEFNPVGFELQLRPWKATSDYHVLVRNFRFAEGGKSMKEQLAETGKIITHGILFDPGSSTIKAESYRTLRDIGNLMKDDTSLRLSVEGHTDSDGTDDYNQNLSEQRAAAVARYLVSNFGIEESRLEFKGWGEAKPLAGNDSPEGKANNRRVELIKL